MELKDAFLLPPEEERALLNAYHEKVRAAIAPHLDGEELAWLMAAMAPILR